MERTLAQGVLDGLNAPQREAATAVLGRVRVVAGAGTGKTRALTARYAYLVNEVGVSPAHVLCLTFTNKAAREMSQRIAGLVGRGEVNDYVCTIHGFCVKVLRRDIYRLGFPQPFSILDLEDCKQVADEVMEELGLKRSDVTVKKILEEVASRKAEGPYVERYMQGGYQTVANDAFTLYLTKQLQRFALDFDDLINFTLYLFATYEEVRSYWQNELQFVMVDEAQDCNHADWSIINTIAEKYRNLFVVGDPDQAIYTWRGAAPELFVRFVPTKDVMLNENYRSTAAILRVANEVIRHNANRIPKELYTRAGQGEAVVHLHAKSEQAQAQRIALEIVKLAARGVRYSEMAVLYRAAYLSRAVEQALVRRRIPYKIWGGIRFFERREVKDALGYLRLIARDDDMAFARVVNVPSRGVGRVYLARLRAAAREERSSLYAALKRHLGERGFRQKKVKEFVEAIEECRAAEAGSSIVDLLDRVLITSGLKEAIRLDGDEDRLENLQELLDSIAYYEAQRKEDGVRLADYLQDVALYTNADYRPDDEAVRLMTVHQAKGLEFRCVFVVGLSEGVFPSYRAMRAMGQAGEEEERRLMYVAATRARERLYLCEAEGYSHVLRQEKCPSRFLLEAGRENYTTEGKIDEALWRSAAQWAGLSGGLPMSLENDANLIGARVSHAVFGEGEVVGVEASGDCRVSFRGVVYTVKRSALEWE